MLFPINELQTDRTGEKHPSYECWISHERRIIMFSRCESFMHMAFATLEELMTHTMYYTKSGYRVG